MVTIRQIAEEARVSAATVSRILNADTTLSVTDETRERVNRIANKYNYRTRQQKKAPDKHHFSVALLMSHSLERENNDDYWRHIKQGIYEEAQRRGINVAYSARFIEGVDLSRLRNYDALIVTGPISRAAVYELKAINQNIVLVDAGGVHYDDIDDVTPNLGSMTRRILDELRSTAQPNIALVTGQNDLVDLDGQVRQVAEDIRTTTYYQWCREHRLTPIVKSGSWDPQFGVDAAEELMHEAPKLDAIVVASDPLAVGVLKVLKEYNLVAGKDISVVSFGDLELVNYIAPLLTTVRLEHFKIGHAAVRLAEDLARKNRDWVSWVTIPTQLIYRETFTKKQIKR